MKKILLFPITLSFFLLFQHSTFAAQAPATSSAEVSPEAVNQKLKERLEKTVLGNSSTTTKWRAVFGRIIQTDAKSITIEKSNKELKTVFLAEDTELSLFQKGRPNKSIKPEEIETDWTAIAMGSQTKETETFDAKRVSFSSAVESPVERKVVIGKISEIDDETIVLVNGTTTTITIPRKYGLYLRNVPKPELEDVNINDRAVAVVEKEASEEEETWNLKVIYVVPSSTNPNADDNRIDEGTPSAQEASQ